MALLGETAAAYDHPLPLPRKSGTGLFIVYLVLSSRALLAASQGGPPASSEAGGGNRDEAALGFNDSSLFAPPPAIVEALARSGSDGRPGLSGLGAKRAAAAAGSSTISSSSASSASSASNGRSGSARRLVGDVEVETQANVLGETQWEWPIGLTLEIGVNGILDPADFGSGSEDGIEVQLIAGLKYFGATILLPNTWTFGVQHNGGAIKLGNGLLTNTRFDCEKTTLDMPMMTSVEGLSPLAMGEIISTFNVLNELSSDLSVPPLRFMTGGEYKLCYNPDGSFTDAAFKDKSIIVPVVMMVYGVDYDCGANDCLLTERWYCYFSYRAESVSPCRIDFRTSGGRTGWTLYEGLTSRVSWSKAWDSDFVSPVDGTYRGAVPKGCSDSTDQTLVIVPESKRFDAMAASAWIGFVTDTVNYGDFPSVNGSFTSDAFTVSACYCPDYDSKVDATGYACDDTSEFVQPIGAVHFWTMRICGVYRWPPCGGNPGFYRILPHQPVVLRLQCPPGGVCLGNTVHKLKFIVPESNPSDENPTWSPFHRCVDEEVSLATNLNWVLPEGVAEGSAAAEDLITGRDSRVFKAWYDTPLLATKTLSEAFDVCYCDADCENIFNYFKVATLRTAQTMGITRFGAEFADGLPAPPETLRYVNKLGSVTLFSGISSPLTEGARPYDAPPFTKTALLKLVSYDRSRIYAMMDDPNTLATLEQSLKLDKTYNLAAQADLDHACGTTPYSEDLSLGPNTADLAKEFMAVIPDGESKNYFSYSGILGDLSFPATLTGTLSICYCAMVNPATQTCWGDNYWIHAAKIMVLGPTGGIVVALPTHFVVRILLSGWGFTSDDTLRAITTTQQCSEDALFNGAFSPAGAPLFKIGCPGISGQNCRAQQRNSSIATYVVSSQTTGLYVREMVVYPTNTTLYFHGDIFQHLAEGDAITIDEESVLYDGKAKAAWTEAERYAVSRFTGIYTYADEPFGDETRMLWNRVSHSDEVPKLDSFGAIISSSLRINVGWPEGDPPNIRFVDDKGMWSQRNKLSTYEEIYASEEQTLRLCWAASDGGQQRYYGDAGTLKFIDPTSMDDAGVHLTGQEQGVQSPVILSFSPARGRPAYKQVTKPLVLRMLFRDVDGVIMPLLTGAPGADLEPLGDSEEVPQANASQAICGKLFQEMWTNDVSGFPFVTGCYYGRKYQDQPAVMGGPLTGGYREYFVEFGKDALKSECIDPRVSVTDSVGCVYQFVVNADVRAVSKADEDVVGFYVKCASLSSPDAGDQCNNPYYVVEYGSGLPSRLSFPTNSTYFKLAKVELAKHGGLRNGTQGVTFEVEEDFINDGTRYMSLEVRAWPADPDKPITRSSVLKLFFFPLTAWDFESSVCQAVCKPPGGLSCADDAGGSSLLCMKGAVVDTFYEAAVPMPKNSFFLSYPAYMDEYIPPSLGDVHLIQINSIDLTPQGFFPTRFLAQLATDYAGHMPSVVETVQIMRLVPQPGLTTGMLLAEGQARAGPQPFVGQRGNTLIVRLTFGYTLRNHPPSLFVPESDGNDNTTNETTVTTTAPPPMFKMMLPEGYVCSIVGNGVADPDGEQVYFSIDRNEDNYVDNPMGTLVGLGTWSASGRSCMYTLFEDVAIFSGQIFYFKIAVNNPWEPLRRDDPKNTWTIQARGASNMFLESAIQFISLEEEKAISGWVGNLAVLLPLAGENIQPTSFLPGATHQLHVFFRAVDWMPEGSFVLIDGPDLFDFGLFCEISDLPASYYSDFFASPWGEGRVGQNARTRRLGAPRNCTGDQWARGMFDPYPTENFTRAIIQASEILEDGAVYGFRIRVTNAPDYSADMHTSWKIWVQSPERYPVDGSRYTVPFSGARVDSLPASPFEKSWALYKEPLSKVSVSFGSPVVAPTSVSVINARVSFFPFTANGKFVKATIRIVAPVGYQWKTSDGFEGQVPNRTCGKLSCQFFVDPSVPPLYPNELLLPDVVLRPNAEYGFQTWMIVPDRPPTMSTNAFFIEIGYNGGDLEERVQGGFIVAPALRILYDMSIVSLCSGAGYADNVLEFHLTTSTALGPNEGFVIKGGAGTFLTKLRCSPKTAVGLGLDKIALPPDLQCSIFDDPLTGLIVAILSVVQEPLPAGDYGIRFEGVTNPLQTTMQGTSWEIGTFGDVHNYPALRHIDKAAVVKGPQVLKWLEDAGILRVPDWTASTLGYDLRPNALNKLIFYFKLAFSHFFPPNTPYIALRAPYGFEFASNCSSQLNLVDHAWNSTWGNATRDEGPALDRPNVTDGWPCAVYPLPAWCPGYIKAWPDGLQPDACLGLRNTARIALSDGNIEANQYFAFELQTTNPMVGSKSSLWALDFGEEASNPFNSFDIRTFNREQTTLFAVTKNVKPRGDDNYEMTPISLRFTPLSEVLGRLQPNVLGTIQGVLTLEMPEGFRFNALDVDDMEACGDGTILEEDGREPANQEAVYSQGGSSAKADTRCSITGYGRQMVWEFVGHKPLVARTRYRLVANVMVPTMPQGASPWKLTSFLRAYPKTYLIPLDRILIVGYGIGAALKSWSVINYSGERMGGYGVRKITMTVGFNVDYLNGDFLVVSSPAGFDLRGDAGSEACDGFMWPTVLLPMPDSPAPVCQCTGAGVSLLCSLTLTADEPTFASARNNIVVEADGLLRFNVSAVNALGLPDKVENYWNVQHYRKGGELLAAATTESWNIVGPIRYISLRLFQGDSMGSGSMSDLELTFMPAVWATVLEMVVHEPLGFDFSKARFETPYFRDDDLVGGRLVIRGGYFKGGVQASLLCQSIILGEAGQTRLDLRLFRDDFMADLAAERINFIKGYRQPGSLIVLGQRLWSRAVIAHHEEGVNDVMLPLLPPHADDPVGIRQEARLELLFTLTAKLPMYKNLVVRSYARYGEDPYRPFLEEGYTPTLDFCFGGASATAAVLAANGGDALPCNASERIDILAIEELIDEERGLPYGVSLLLNASMLSDGDALVVGQLYRLHMWMSPSVYTSKLGVDALDGGPLPVATNDGLTAAIQAVAMMTLKVEIAYTRIPPMAVLDATITLRAGANQRGFTELAVALPPGLSPFGMGMSSDPYGTKRLVSKIPVDSSALEAIMGEGMAFKLRIITPPVDPRDLRWFVMARKVTHALVGSLESDTTVDTGWAVAEGFRVLPMPVRLVYGAIVDFTGWLAVSFLVPAQVNGMFAKVDAPPGYSLQCPDKTILSKPCATLISVPRQANVTLVDGIKAGSNFDYAFLLSVTTPSTVAEVAVEAAWSVVILNVELLPVDSTGPFVYRPLVDYFLTRPTLAWRTPPQHDESAVVVIEFTLWNRIEGLKAILIELPFRYKHDIQHRNQFKSLNPLFPTAIDVEWRNFKDSLSWVRILANDDVPKERDFIPAGTFQFEFPVRVPAQLPTNLEWYFSLCEDYSCQTKDDRSVKVAFPVPNTDPINAASLWKRSVATADAGCAWPGAWWLMSFVAVFLLGGSE